MAGSGLPAATQELVKIRRSSPRQRKLRWRSPSNAPVSPTAAGLTDDAWANAAKHYDDEQLAGLVSLVALINTYNRMNVITRQPAGDYTPGQWG